MQKLIQTLTLLTLSSIISISYGATNQPIDSAESFSNMVKANQKAAKESAATEVSSEAPTPATGSSGTSAADQAKGSMNSTNTPNTPASSNTPPAASTPATPASTPTTSPPPATTPTPDSDPYSGYTGKSDTTPNKAGAADDKKGWNLGY